MVWCTEVYQHLQESQYQAVVKFYEDAVRNEPEIISHTWYLGLAYLLQGYENVAQEIWLEVLNQSDAPETGALSNDLLKILELEARNQENLGQLKSACYIRNQIRKIDPNRVENTLHLISNSIDINEFNPEFIKDWGIINILEKNKILDEDLLLQTLSKVIGFPNQYSLDFAESCIPHIQDKEDFVSKLYPVFYEKTYQSRLLYYSAALAEFYLKIIPSNFYYSKELSRIYTELREYSKAINMAERTYSIAYDRPSTIIGNGTLLTTLMRAGSWQEIPQIFERHKQILNKFHESKDDQVSLDNIREIYTQTSLLSYHKDDLVENRLFQNSMASLFEKAVIRTYSSFFDTSFSVEKKLNKRIKIGYIAHTFRSHSVGWLCRSIFRYHNRDLFEICIYFVNQNKVNQNLENSFFETWFYPNVDHAYSLGNDALTIAQKIRSDQIDILIDLDSTTLDLTCTVMALKPAPIQATWLGFDASGLSTIDYFIADSYVLPIQAQEHYVEKILRLPTVYVAVDGFEVDVPTLKREDFGLPANAVVFLTAQAGMKRHPDMIRMQMQIVKDVANGFLFIKGLSDEDQIQTLFIQLAKEEGLDPSHLRFLPRDLNEYIHRANLQIADVVLDTYPYNGATTTLETLWMNIPIVTKVGEQFAARNSYTFMMNAGVTEGIAWTDEDYITWGIRLGRDEDLRQQVAWKLKVAKQRSPLWNAKQFTLDMENGYLRMWKSYLPKI